MIFKKKTQARWVHKIEQRKSEIIYLAGGDEATVDSVLSVLFGTAREDYEDNQYFVYGYDEEGVKQKWWHRVNTLWLVPLVLVFVFPVQWLLYGRTGIRENTKFGRVVLKMVGGGDE